MILCDRSLRAIIKDILPCERNPKINPASIELTLGAYILSQPLGGNAKWTDENLQRVKGFDLLPKEVLLVSTSEIVCIPVHLVGEVKLKSSRAREGFNMANAGFIDPGWRGVLTFQIYNNLTWKRMGIYYQEPFFQLILHTLDDIPQDPYSGKYQGAERVEGVK